MKVAGAPGSAAWKGSPVPAQSRAHVTLYYHTRGTHQGMTGALNRAQGRVGTHTIRTHKSIVDKVARAHTRPAHTQPLRYPRKSPKYPVILMGNMSEGDPPSDRARVTGAINCVNSMLLTRINFLTNDLLEGALFLVKSIPKKKKVHRQHTPR